MPSDETEDVQRTMCGPPTGGWRDKHPDVDMQAVKHEMARLVRRSEEHILQREGSVFDNVVTKPALDWTTKDSGERAEYASGMVRDTEDGKPRFDLLLPRGIPYKAQILTRFAALMARGAVKYEARNWEKADSTDELMRYESSLFRHTMQYLAGETDEDHAAAVMFNLMAAETLKYKMSIEEDNTRIGSTTQDGNDDQGYAHKDSGCDCYSCQG